MCEEFEYPIYMISSKDSEDLEKSLCARVRQNSESDPCDLCIKNK